MRSVASDYCGICATHLEVNAQVKIKKKKSEPIGVGVVWDETDDTALGAGRGGPAGSGGRERGSDVFGGRRGNGGEKGLKNQTPSGGQEGRARSGGGG